MLLDQKKRILQDLRLSVIDKCNFRCPYCMPSEIYGESYEFLEKDNLLSFSEIVDLSRLFVRFGVKKIKITGGEPLLRPWLPDLVKELKQIPDLKEVALITNGYHLPNLVDRLKKAGLDRVTISLDSLDSENFKRLNGRGYDIDRVLQGVKLALEAGFGPIKINMVVMKGKNDHEILDMVRRFETSEYILRFIEYMDVGTINSWNRSEVVPSKDILESLRDYYTLEAIEANYQGEVAKRYRIKETNGELGFISSVSQPFCDSCTRARLSASGMLHTCLFSHKGHDLRTLLRSSDQYEEGLKLAEEKIQAIWTSRVDAYSQERAQVLAGIKGIPKSKRDKVEMYHIGG